LTAARKEPLEESPRIHRRKAARKKIEELNIKYDKAFNENDAEAIAALFPWNTNKSDL
jgi:hypothetical protein